MRYEKTRPEVVYQLLKLNCQRHCDDCVSERTAVNRHEVIAILALLNAIFNGVSH
jgi:hypothetical protein